jgi:hypothetical protein
MDSTCTARRFRAMVSAGFSPTVRTHVSVLTSTVRILNESSATKIVAPWLGSFDRGKKVSDVGTAEL